MANSPARSTIDVGSVIAETYTIEALIGRGGMGAVFLASHNRLPGKKVAIKLLHAELTDEDVVARFRREALIASQLAHPNIVGVTDFNVTPDGTPYLVLEYLEGETLAQRLKRGPLPLDETLSLVRQVGSAVAAAHRAGIVHRDLKPQNIFLVPTEVAGHSVEIAKVLDFGISKIRGSQTVKTQESTLLGTPQYMAPEQATGQHATVDERTDVFALGAIVHEMLSGQPAFDGASIPEVVFKVVYEAAAPLAVPELPPAISAAIERAMAKRADDRFASVSDFVEALTGMPLAQARLSAVGLPEVGLPASARLRSANKLSNHEAFAKTMGSVDRPVSPQAPTVESPSAAADRKAALPRRKPVAGIAIAIGGAAIAAVAMYLVMRREPPPQQPVAAGSRDAAVMEHAATPDAAVAPALDAAAVVIVPPDAPPAREVVKTAETEPDDDTARGQLEQADAAFAAGEYDRAERLANTVINAQSAGSRQRAHAHAIHGAIECTMRNSREGATTDLRNIRNRPKYRRMMIDACAKAGIDLR